MLLADQTRDYSAGALGATDLDARFAELEARAARDLPGAKVSRLADLRYRGQSYELTVPWTARGAEKAFHAAHERIYGYSDKVRAVEVVTIRVQAVIAVRKPVLKKEKLRAVEATERRVWIAGKWRKIPVLSRESVGLKASAGPALILDYGATTVVTPGWRYRSDAFGNLLLLRHRDPRHNVAD